MIDESHPQNPINPYGKTKLMVEKILRAYGRPMGSLQSAPAILTPPGRTRLVK
ncbi:MAG: hypothetical protein N2A40_07785 [Desulfobulbaceae bacterium]